jgi:ABC-type antimicrobial peptide transport system permease subunit
VDLNTSLKAGGRSGQSDGGLHLRRWRWPQRAGSTRTIETFAQRFWPNSDPIGKHLWFHDPKKPITIVGVVGVVKQYGLETDGKIATYFPYQQFPDQRMFLAVRTSPEAAGLSSAVVSQIHAVDPDVVVYDIRTMQERLYDSLARRRFASTMLGAFAVFALLLAAVGLYGVMSHLVTQSTHDIGVLVTLGARPGNIIGLVVRQGMELAGIGIAVGLVGALGLTRVMNSLVFGGEYHRCAHLRDSAGAVGGRMMLAKSPKRLSAPEAPAVSLPPLLL